MTDTQRSLVCFNCSDPLSRGNITDFCSDRCQDEHQHEQKITDSRACLWEALARAEADMKRALEAHRKLAGGEAFDVEYEGTNTEFAQYLAETHRLLVITRALMPTASDATTDVDPALKDTVRALMGGSHLK